MSRVKFLGTVIALGLLALFAIPSIALAQGDIQISRPLDGATVREIVNIIVPAASIPADGSVSYSIDERFRTASSQKSADRANFVYQWDTKQIDPDTSARMEVRLPRDGKRTITVQAYDKSGKRAGKGKTITIYVKNNASSDMPASGLRLIYRYIPNTSAKYKFSGTLSVKSVQGDTTIGSRNGGIISGKEGIIRRTVEDLVSQNTAMIRQRLVGNMSDLSGGTPVPDTSITPKSSYRIENQYGTVESVINSSSPGTIITVDMPKLPMKRVRIGDTWTLKQKVFRDPTSDDSATFTTINTLEGLEWEGGFPCAKIKSKFAGDVKIPGTDIVKDAVSVSGETTTFFAYRSGKLIFSRTTATAEATLNASAISSLTSGSGRGSSGGSTMPGGMMPGGMPTMPGGMPSMPGGMMPGGMPGMIGMPGMPGMSGGTMPGMGGSSASSRSQDEDVTFLLTHTLRLVR